MTERKMMSREKYDVVCQRLSQYKEQCDVIQKDKTWEGTITLYFKCLKCGKAQSHLAHPPEVGPFKDCPYCGGEIEFEPNCWTCEEFNGLMCDVADCIGFKFYKQRKVKT